MRRPDAFAHHAPCELLWQSRSVTEYNSLKKGLFDWPLQRQVIKKLKWPATHDLHATGYSLCTTRYAH